MVQENQETGKLPSGREGGRFTSSKTIDDGGTYNLIIDRFLKEIVDTKAFARYEGLAIYTGGKEEKWNSPACDVVLHPLIQVEPARTSLEIHFRDDHIGCNQQHRLNSFIVVNGAEDLESVTVKRIAQSGEPFFVLVDEEHEFGAAAALLIAFPRSSSVSSVLDLKKPLVYCRKEILTGCVLRFDLFGLVQKLPRSGVSGHGNTFLSAAEVVFCLRAEKALPWWKGFQMVGFFCNFVGHTYAWHTAATPVQYRTQERVNVCQ